MTTLMLDAMRRLRAGDMVAIALAVGFLGFVVYVALSGFGYAEHYRRGEQCLRWAQHCGRTGCATTCAEWGTP